MTILHKQFNKEVLPYFELPINLDLLKFDIQDNWLSVYVKENLNAQGKDLKYKLVCAQSLTDYMVTIDETDTLLTRAIINRITLMLAEKLRSALQDINILYEKRTNFELILMLIALISWVLLFIKDWQLGLLIFFIIWGNNLQIK